MKIIDTPLHPVKLIIPDIFRDNRGIFTEIYNQKHYPRLLKHPNLQFVQTNYSRSNKNVLRGLHFQKKYPQGKLISCVHGAIFDVAVDIQVNSPNFGRWVAYILTEENQRQLWIPEGFAHGFLTLSDTASIIYQCTQNYVPDDQHCIQWNDPSINIYWPTNNPILSQQDQHGILLSELTQ